MENKNIKNVNNEENESVTREINLDELYDGAINNTVIIDPITNDELLINNKKHNYTIIGVAVAISILLLLYFVTNKTDIGKPKADVIPNTTVTTTTTIEKGTLSCKYSSKSDAETQEVTFLANYEGSNVLLSEFNYSVVKVVNTESVIVTDLISQYENFYISNNTSSANTINFDKTDSGFTFYVKTDYTKDSFDSIVVSENQTILYQKPSKSDNIDSLKNIYTNKGFVCEVNNNKEISE